MKNQRPKNILLVEDDKIQAKLIKQYLSDNEYRVTAINNGEIACNYLFDTANQIDVVIIDYNLPGKNGIEVIQEMNKAGKLFAFVLVTIEKNPQIAVEAMKMGATDFVCKTESFVERLPLIIEKSFYAFQERLVKIRMENELKQRNQEIQEKNIRLQEKNQEIFEHHKELAKSYAKIKEVNAKLNRSEAWNRKILSNIQDGLTLIDKKGVRFYNDKAIEIFGYPEDEFVKKSGFDFAAPEEIPRIKNILKKIKNGEKIEKFEYWIVQKNGTKKYILNRYVDIEDSLRMVITTDLTLRKKAEVNMRQTMQRFKKLVDTIPYGIDQTDAGGFITFSNKAHHQMMEYDDGELIGKHISELRGSKVDKQKAAEYMRNVIDEEPEPETYYDKNITKNGKTIDVQIDWDYIRNEDGEITGFINVISDITERRKAEKAIKESEKKFRTLAENSNDFIMRYDTQGHHIYVNSTVLEYSGLAKNQIIGKTHEKAGFDKEQSRFWQEKIRQVVRNKQQFRTEFDWKSTTGWITLDWRLSPEFDDEGNVISVLGVSRDITEMKTIQKELIKAKLKAEESDRLKSAFLANMSHEIRTPLNGILGFVELLDRERISEEKRKKYIAMINDSSQQLLNIINDILFMSRLEVGQLEVNYNEFHLNVMVFQLYSLFKTAISNSGKDIELHSYKALGDKESRIVADENKIRQILSCLINNAIKFTKSGYIEFGYTFNHDEKFQNGNKPYLLFYVKDTGIGIPKEKYSLIFERFRQAEDALTRRFGGLGLGLSIVKGLINLLHGQIWVESEENEGSTFYFTVPYYSSMPEEDSKDVETSEPKFDWHDKTILIVEDDYTGYIYLESLLEETNAKILHAKNGEDAINQCRINKDIDVVLMDMQLPHIDGYEATQIIKDMRKKLPVIAQTANALSEDKDKCLNVGCNDYIAKPYSSNQMIDMVAKYVNNKKENATENG